MTVKLLKFYIRSRKAFAAGYGAAASVIAPKILAGQQLTQGDLALALGLAILVGGAVFFAKNSA